MLDLLTAERALLDQVFGKGQFELREAKANCAELVFRDMKFGFVRDRNALVYADVDVPNPRAQNGMTQSPVNTWRKFAGLPESKLEFDRRGFAVQPPDDQLRLELHLIDRLLKEVLLDPRMREQGASFVEGYNAAYNEWAAGEWSPDWPADSCNGSVAPPSRRP